MTKHKYEIYKIKDLCWEIDKSGLWANTNFPHEEDNYAIRYQEQYYLYTPSMKSPPETYDTMEEARAAAQNDFEQTALHYIEEI